MEPLRRIQGSRTGLPNVGRRAKAGFPYAFQKEGKTLKWNKN